MAAIPLTQGRTAIVDDELYEELSKHRWHLTCKGYAGRAPYPGKTIFMHRVVNQTPDGMQTDHINGNKLDNRRANLRSCTNTENSRARRRKPPASGLRGVKRGPSGKFYANIWVEGKHRHLGTFESGEAAHAAYRSAALEHFGQFAPFENE